MPRKVEGSIVAGRYRLGRRIGAGSFGEVFIGTDLRTGTELAVKTEPLTAQCPRLLYEAKICGLLAGGFGIPVVHWSGVDGEHAVMVTELLGPSLEDLLRFCCGRFRLKTVLMVADQVLRRIEQVHANCIVHRDIKPDNFVIGLGSKANLVHIIDFGLATHFRRRPTEDSTTHREGGGLIGTARFASINAHLGLEQGPRDDLEAIGYMLVYFSQGRLPWQGVVASSPQARYEAIGKIKRSTPAEVLCKKLPAELVMYVDYCKGLAFQDCPDYTFLRRLLRDVFLREGFRFDFTFEWTLEALGMDRAARDLADREDPEEHATGFEALAQKPTVVEVAG